MKVSAAQDKDSSSTSSKPIAGGNVRPIAGSEASSTYASANEKRFSCGAHRKRTPRSAVNVPSERHPRYGTTLRGMAGTKAVSTCQGIDM